MTEAEFNVRIQKLADKMREDTSYPCKSWIPRQHCGTDNLFTKEQVVGTLTYYHTSPVYTAKNMQYANDLWREANKK